MKHKITGTITLPNGQAAVNLTVRAQHQTLKSAVTLGTATTNQNGNYAIEFTRKVPVNLVMVVMNATSRVPLVTSEIEFKIDALVERNFEVDFKAFKGWNLFQTLEHYCQAALSGLSVEKLSDKQLLLLANQTGFELALLQDYKSAQVLAAKYGLMSTVTFALLRNSDGRNIFSFGMDEFNHILTQAVGEHLIPPIPSKTLVGQRGIYQRLQIQQKLTDRMYDSGISYGRLWGMLRIPTGASYKAAEIALQHEGTTDSLWEELQNTPNVDNYVPKMKLAVGVNNLTLGNLALVNYIARMKHIQSLEALAMFTIQDWVTYIQRSGGSRYIPKEIPGHKLNDKLVNYARYLTRVTSTLYPSKALFGGILKGKLPQKLKTDYTTFMANNPEFDFNQDSPDLYIRTHKTALNNVKDKPTLTAHLNQVARLAKIVPDMDKADGVNALLNLNIDGAFDLLNHSRSALSAEISNPGLTNAIYSIAQHRVAIVENLNTTLVRDWKELPYVMNYDLREDSTWKAIFGSEDYCECEHCRSLYGPAAYLTDLLHFLEKRTVSFDNSKPVFEVLNERRPDIQEILLNCENAHTPMPYIDLVNEILENLVASGKDQVQHEHQTTHIAELLKIAPEHLNITAYEKLKNIGAWLSQKPIWPWQLPFDFWTLMGRNHLSQLGVRQEDLHQTMLPKITHKSVLQHHISRLRLSRQVIDLILIENYSSVESDHWGLSFPRNREIKLSDLRRVTQLSLAEIQALISTKFIGQGNLELDMGDACDMSRVKLKLLVRTAERFYKFTRLWSHTDFSIDELDAALSFLNTTKIDGHVINQLGAMVEISQKTNRSFSEIVNYFSEDAPQGGVGQLLNISQAELDQFAKIRGLNQTLPTDVVKLMGDVNHFNKAQVSIPDFRFILGETDAELYPLTRRRTILESIRAAIWKHEISEEENETLSKDKLVIQTLANVLTVDVERLEILLAGKIGGWSKADFIEKFTSEKFINPNASEPEILHFNQYLSPLLIATFIANKLPHFKIEHWNYLVDQQGNWFSFAEIGQINDAGTSFIDLLKLHQLIPEWNESAAPFFHPEVDFNLLLDWDFAREVYNLTGDQNLTELERLFALTHARNSASHLKVTSFDQFQRLFQFEYAPSVADEIIQLTKSHYTTTQWNKVAEQLRADLRETQRDYLLRYLIAKEADYRTSADLYARFLIDPEMSACTVTSRIKLALSSVQLFVQRCLLNLEPQVDLSNLTDFEKEEWEEWTWRKNYRVWEANRKIFLYPENWLEPNWRDDKTPIFEKLERQLLQGELNTENAEKVYRTYLQELDEVSNLQYIGLGEGEDLTNSEVNTYYLFGQTTSTPKKVFFRKYELYPEKFGPWKEIEMDFEGYSVLPVVNNGKLNLFWIESEVKSKPAGRQSSGNGEYNQPSKYIEAKIAWVEYYNEEWSAKKTSSYFITIDEVKAEYKERMRLDIALKNGDKFLLITALGISPSTYIPPQGPDAPGITISDSQIGSQVLGGYQLTTENQLDRLEEETLDAQFPKWFQYAKHPYEPQNEVQLGNVIVSHYSHAIFDLSEFNSELDTWANWTQSYAHLGSYYAVAKYRHYVENNGAKLFFRSNILKKRSNNLPNLSIIYENGIDGYIKQALQTENLFATENGAYAQYNWELFYHIPVHIADKLRQDQKFEEAQEWFHHVFDPTAREGNSPDKFWKFIPFKDLIASDDDEVPRNIRDLLAVLGSNESTETLEQLDNQISLWESNPFNPHSVARLRIIAYMKWTVMRYIDNIVEWADYLFRQDTIESLNEATQLYMMAYHILGEHPNQVPAKQVDDQNYKTLSGAGLDDFSNTTIAKIESYLNQLPTQSNRFDEGKMYAISEMTDGPAKQVSTLALPDYDLPKLDSVLDTEHLILNTRTSYFCIPPNDKFLGYWGMLQDRLFKLRNCLNIEGVFRQLPLYQPPIDPALLIKAKLAGVTIAEALSTTYTGSSNYRFTFLLAKAIDYTNDVRTFGSMLLSAIEKRDAEEMAQLRSTHEGSLLTAIKEVRQLQIDETKEVLASANRSLEMGQQRFEYYNSREFMNSGETAQMVIMALVNRMQLISQTTSMGAAAAKGFPDFSTGYAGLGGYFATHVGGGSRSGSIADSVAQAFSAMSGLLNITASEMGQMASYQRRADDWSFQAELAKTEMKQTEKQIAAAEIRNAISKYELNNHNLQIEQNQAQNELLTTKFSNKQLYDWMVEELRTLYFQSYQMAFDMAKKAENAWNTEIAPDTSRSFLQFGYWNNLKEGLLSGEKLLHDLKRMEMAYIEQNKRDFELSQTFSLAMIAPQELVKLRDVGTAEFLIPEILFDMAYPAHQNRKIKSVSVSVPAVAGPYTGVHCTLSRAEDQRAIIATSSGQNDAGMFQFNLGDERYFPFENLTPHGLWHLNMGWKSNQLRPFDYNSIADVLIHINYTAEQGEDRSGTVQSALGGQPLKRYFSLKSEFANEWFAFKNAVQNGTAPASLTIFVEPEQYPFFAKGETINIDPDESLFYGVNTNGEILGLSLSLTENNGEFTFTEVGTITENIDDLWLVVEYNL